MMEEEKFGHDSCQRKKGCGMKRSSRIELDEAERRERKGERGRESKEW